MAQILGLETGISLPTVTTSIFGTGFTIVASLVFIALAGIIAVYLFNQKRIYNKTIIVFENIAGQGFQVNYKDKARLVSIGDGGEEILYLKKKKVYRSAYGKKMGKNTYWFAVGQDGYWYNVLLGDLDAKMGMLDIEPIDRDMRYMHVAIRKNIQERYRKISFMEKYGVMLMNGVFLMIMLGGLWLLIDQIGELIQQATTTVEASGKTVEPLEKIVSHLDTILSGGSGISQVPTT